MYHKIAQIICFVLKFARLHDLITMLQCLSFSFSEWCF